jgi:hypothetical protein
MVFWPKEWLLLFIPPDGRDENASKAAYATSDLATILGRLGMVDATRKRTGLAFVVFANSYLRNRGSNCASRTEVAVIDAWIPHSTSFSTSTLFNRARSSWSSPSLENDISIRHRAAESFLLFGASESNDELFGRFQSGLAECIDDNALADDPQEIARPKRVLINNLTVLPKDKLAGSSFQFVGKASQRAGKIAEE